jgi:maleamate amidohydrolase
MTTLEHLLHFYDKRGYGRRIGMGHAPAVLVIDFSIAFTGGRFEFPGGDFGCEIAQTLRILKEARSRKLPVLFTTIAYDDPARDAGYWGKKVPWLEHCRAGTRLVEIDPSLERQPAEPLIVKRFPSSFYQTDLQNLLEKSGVDTLVICGCTTSVCVRATALDAMQHGYRAIVAAEAVGDFDPGIHALNLADVNARYADVMPVDEIVHALRGVSRI